MNITVAEAVAQLVGITDPQAIGGLHLHVSSKPLHNGSDSVQQQLQMVEEMHAQEKLVTEAMEQQLGLEPDHGTQDMHLPKTAANLQLVNNNSNINHTEVRRQLAAASEPQHAMPSAADASSFPTQPMSTAHKRDTHLPYTHIPDTHLPETHIPGAQIPDTHIQETHMQLVNLANDVPKCQVSTCEREACRSVDGSASLCLVHMLEQGVQPAYNQLAYTGAAAGLPWGHNPSENSLGAYSHYCQSPDCKQHAILSEDGHCSYCIDHILQHGQQPASQPKQRSIMQDLSLASNAGDYPHCEANALSEDPMCKRRHLCAHEGCTRVSCPSADGRTIFCKVHMLLHGLPPSACDPHKTCAAPGCTKRGMLASDNKSMFCMRHMAESGLQRAANGQAKYCQVESCPQAARPGPNDRWEFCRQHQLEKGLWEGLRDHPRYPKKRGRPRTNPTDPAELPSLPKRPCAHPGCTKSAQAAADGPFMFCRGHQRCHGLTPPETRRRMCVEGGCNKFAVANTEGVQDYCKAHMRTHGQTPMAKMCVLPDCTKRAQKGIDGKYAYCKAHLHERGLHPGTAASMVKRDRAGTGAGGGLPITGPGNGLPGNGLTGNGLPSSVCPSTGPHGGARPSTPQLPPPGVPQLPSSPLSLPISMPMPLDATSLLLQGGPGMQSPDGSSMHLLLLPSSQGPTNANPPSGFSPTGLKGLQEVSVLEVIPSDGTSQPPPQHRPSVEPGPPPDDSGVQHNSTSQPARVQGSSSAAPTVDGQVAEHHLNAPMERTPLRGGAGGVLSTTQPLVPPPPFAIGESLESMIYPADLQLLNRSAPPKPSDQVIQYRPSAQSQQNPGPISAPTNLPRLDMLSGPSLLSHAMSLQRQVSEQADRLHSQHVAIQQLRQEQEQQHQILDSHKHIVQQQQLRIDQLTVALQNCQHLATAALQQEAGHPTQLYSQLLVTMQEALHSQQAG